MKPDPLLFIHIPKTAGTSFRNSAEAYFGPNNVTYDYGIDNQLTGAIIKNHADTNTDLYLLKHNVTNNSLRFIAGHFPAMKYINIFHCENTITFLRDPLQRLYSEYRHFVRHNNYKSSFEAFYSSPKYQNRQSRILSGLPIFSYGFIGITDYYSESIKLINKKWGLRLDVLENNISKESDNDIYNLDKETLEAIADVNSRDIKQYRLALSFFKDRLIFSNNKIPFARGMFKKATNGIVQGWAVWDSSDKPVEIRIDIDDKNIATVPATKYRKHLHSLGIRRNGYVGFSYKIGGTKNRKVSCTVNDTGQKIFCPSDEGNNHDQSLKQVLLTS